MKLDDLFPSKYLKASDLNGKAVKLIIVNVELVDIVGKGRKEDDKPVITFQRCKKELVLNITNGRTLGEHFGDETTRWIDKEIELYPDKTQFQGQIVDCLRVRVPVPAAEGDPQDDINF